MALAVALIVLVLESLALAYPDQILDVASPYVESGCQAPHQEARVKVEDLNMTYSRVYPIDVCIEMKEDPPRPCQAGNPGSQGLAMNPSQGPILKAFISPVRTYIRNHETNEVKDFKIDIMVQSATFYGNKYCAMIMPCMLVDAFKNAKMGQVSAESFATLVAEKTTFRLTMRAVSESVQWGQQTDMAYPLESPKTPYRSLRCTAPNCKMVNVEKNVELEDNRGEGVWEVLTIVEGRWPICDDKWHPTERIYLFSQNIRESDPPQFVKVESLFSS